MPAGPGALILIPQKLISNLWSDTAQLSIDNFESRRDCGDSALAPKGVVRIRAGRRQCQLSALSARHVAACTVTETSIRILRSLHDLGRHSP